MELVKNTDNVKDLSNSIIPPTWFKGIEEYPFQQIWKKAREEVRTARIIVVVGYSVPNTDLFSKSLFKVESRSKKREKLDLVVLVNPDPTARNRFVDIFSGGINSHTKILELDYLEELANLLPN